MSAILAITANRGQTIAFAVVTLVFLAMAITAIRRHRPRRSLTWLAIYVLFGIALTAASASGVVFTRP